MKIKRFTVGKLLTNCYLAICSKKAEAIIIDPGFETALEAEQVISYVNQNSLKVRFIVDTHGHMDHISGNKILKLNFVVPVCIHNYDAHYLTNLDGVLPPNVLLEDGSLLKFGQVTLRVVYTPGHTFGSISVVGNGFVFTGDTLFAGGIGRTDFPGGSSKDMRASLRRLSCLPSDYVIYPGHGSMSTIGKEKQFNPFLSWL